MSRFAVIFGFCTLLAGTQEIMTSRDEHRGPTLIFMSLKHPPPRTCLEREPWRIKKLRPQKFWAKCQDLLCVIFGFCTLLAGTQEIMTSRD
jgi:hypothetical protein